LVRPMSLGAERALDDLSGTSSDESEDPPTGLAHAVPDADQSWLTRSVALITSLRESGLAGPMRPPEPTAIVLLIESSA
jgi:hypothetical protein